jgi:hypothetical protein
MPSTDMITERLDTLEANLPTIPAKVLHFQRTLAGKTYENYTAAVGAVTDSYKSFLDTAVASGKSVTSQARAAGEQFVASVSTGLKTVTNQAVAQGKKVSTAAQAEATDLVDSATDAVDDAPGTGTPYEEWTKAELVERAKELKIVGPTRMSKSALIKVLRKA